MRRPPYSLKLLTPPTTEPVLLQDAKDWCRISDSSQDSVITSLISAARFEAEKYTRRSFISTQWIQKQDTFPPTGLGQVNMERLQFFSYNNAGEVVFPRSPLITVDTVAYQDANGSTITMTPGTDYVVDLNPDHGRIFLPFGKIWPITYPQQNAVSLTFTAGYGANAAAVPEGIKTAIKMLVANWYELREPVLVSGAVPQIIPFHLQALLWGFRSLDF